MLDITLIPLFFFFLKVEIHFVMSRKSFNFALNIKVL